MTYQKPIYVAFDGKNDLETFQQLSSFQDQDGNSFPLIHAHEWSTSLDKIPEEQLKLSIYRRMSEAELVVLLIGKTTKTMRKFIRWQVDFAVNNDFPIIVINPNPIRSVDFDRIPSVLKKKTRSLHIPLEPKIFEIAVHHWIGAHKELLIKEKTGTFRYPLAVYEALGNPELEQIEE